MLFIKYTLFEAYKRKLWLLQILLVGVCVAMGMYASALSITETRDSFVMVYAAAVRLGSALILGLYILTVEGHNLDSARIQNYLVLPIGRSGYLLQKLCAYALLCALLTLLSAMPLSVLVTPVTLSLWALALWLELLLMMTVAWFLSVKQQQAVFSVSMFFVFYLFARSAREFYWHSQAILAEAGGSWERLLAWPLRAITYLVPHLADYAAAARLLYPQDVAHLSIWNLCLQSLLYGGILYTAALVALWRKEF